MCATRDWTGLGLIHFAHILCDFAVTDEEFLDYFQKFGEVIDSVVMTDRVTRRSRGFGFVTFASEVRVCLQ